MPLVIEGDMPHSWSRIDNDRNTNLMRLASTDGVPVLPRFSAVFIDIGASWLILHGIGNVKQTTSRPGHSFCLPEISRDGMSVPSISFEFYSMDRAAI